MPDNRNPLVIARRPQAACLAVAGPTDGRSVRLTNLDWVIESEEISSLTGIPKVRLVNDFAAVGHGLSVLDAGGYATVQTGQPVAHPALGILDRMAGRMLQAGDRLGMSPVARARIAYPVSPLGDDPGTDPDDDLLLG